MKKLIAVLLTMVMVMCGGAGLTSAFAETEEVHVVTDSELTTIPSGDYTQIGENGGRLSPSSGFVYQDWVEYEVNVLTAGYYDIYMTYATDQAIYSAKEVISINGGTEKEITVEPTEAFSKKSTVTISRVTFNEGKNTIKLRATSGTIYIVNFGIKYAHLVEVESSTSVLAGEYTQKGENGGRTSPSSGFVYQDWAEYEVNVLTAGYYDLTMTYATDQAKYGANEKISVNGGTEKIIEAAPTPSFSEKATISLGHIKLNKGKNTIKLTAASGTVYIVSFGVEYAYNVKAEEMTTIIANEFTDGDNGTLIKPSSGFQYNHWNEYIVNVETAGYYKLYTTYRTDNAKYGGKVGASVNGGTETEVSLDPTPTYTYTAEPVYLRDVKLNKGLNIIKVRGLGGTVYIGNYHLEFKNTVKEMSLSIPAKEYTGDYNVLAVEGGHVVMGYNCYTSYDVIVKNAGYYNVYLSCGIGQANFGFGIGLNGEKIVESVIPTTGGLGTITEKLVANVYMDEGMNTINITSISAGSCYFDTVRIEGSQSTPTPVINAVKLSDSDRVTAGTHDIVVDVTNVSGAKGKLICALYSGNKLEKVFISTNAVPNGAVVMAEDYAVDPVITKVKAMFLKDMDVSLIPLCGAEEITK